jgi:hypothetical protein
MHHEMQKLRDFRLKLVGCMIPGLRFSHVNSSAHRISASHIGVTDRMVKGAKQNGRVVPGR